MKQVYVFRARELEFHKFTSYVQGLAHSAVVQCHFIVIVTFDLLFGRGNWGFHAIVLVHELQQVRIQAVYIFLASCILYSRKIGGELNLADDCTHRQIIFLRVYVCVLGMQVCLS